MAIKLSRLFACAVFAVLVGFSVIAPQPASAGTELSVRDFVIARDIIDREPVDVTDTFLVSDSRAFAFARISNPGDPTTLSFMWTYNNIHHATVDLKIGTSGSWRTWSSVELAPGTWEIKVVTEDGTVIAKTAFTVGG